MTLRSRFKKRKLNEGDDEEEKIDTTGASYLRYEIIEKRGKQFVVPVRYSIRRAVA